MLGHKNFLGAPKSLYPKHFIKIFIGYLLTTIYQIYSSPNHFHSTFKSKQYSTTNKCNVLWNQTLKNYLNQQLYWFQARRTLCG